MERLYLEIQILCIFSIRIKRKRSPSIETIYKDSYSDGIFTIIRCLISTDCNFYLTGAVRLRRENTLVPSHSLLYSRFYSRKKQGLSSLIFCLCQKRIFSSGNTDINDITNSISLSSISKLGIETYENSLEYRELIRKGFYEFCYVNSDLLCTTIWCVWITMYIW